MRLGGPERTGVIHRNFYGGRKIRCDGSFLLLGGDLIIVTTIMPPSRDCLHNWVNFNQGATCLHEGWVDKLFKVHTFAEMSQ
jgi:hypothetical protein